MDNHNLKEKFLEVLEAKGVSLEVLSKLLDPAVNRSQFKTVYELVKNHEEQHGDISLEKWETMFECLGYLIDYRCIIEQSRQLRGFPSTCLDEPLLEADDDQKAEGTGRTSHSYVVESSKEPNNKKANIRPDLRLVAMSTQFTNRLPVISGLDNDTSCHDNLTATMKVTVGPMEPPKCPSWSLPPLSPPSSPPPPLPPSSPPPEQKECKVMNSENDDNCGATTVAAGAQADSGFLSTQNRETNMFANDQSSPSHSYMSDTSVLSSSAMSSLISETDQQNETSDEQPSSLSNSLDSATALANLGSDISSQGSADTPARPAATAETETGHPLLGASSSFVAGHLPACHSQIIAGLETTGYPVENYDETESFCLHEKLQKENEELRLTISFLAQELRLKTSLCANLRDQKYNLQRELLECRAQCAEWQEQISELTRHLNDSAVLEAESQQLIRMIQEMLGSKQEECNRLEEHIRQSGEMYDNSISNMEALRRERQEVSELLMSLRTQLEEVQRDRENFRVQERERLRMEHERLLEVRLEEIHVAFGNAETDKVKALKLKLKREKEKRKRMENKNRDTLKSSSEVEADNPARSSSFNHESASDESSDDELFEDALEHIGHSLP